MRRRGGVEATKSVSWWTWQSMSQRVDDLWEEATEASERAGVAYIGRDGQRYGDAEDFSLVAVAIKKWTEAREASASSRGRQ